MTEQPPESKQEIAGQYNAQASGEGASATVIVTNASPPMAPGSAPPLPQLFLGREEDIVRLKTRLGVPGPDGTTSPMHRFTVIRGWPGVGKTTFAAVLAHDPAIAKAFPDGVLWASLGQQPSLFAELLAWGRALGNPDLGRATSIDEASAQLTALLRQQRRLLIVDDVWDVAHLTPFQVGGQQCALLVTTRLPSVALTVAADASDVYVLGVLSDTAGLDLLRMLAPAVVAQNPDDSRALVQELEGLPLAIQVAGRLLHTEASYGFGVGSLLVEIRQRAAILRAQAPADRAEEGVIPSVTALLQKSTDLLDSYILDCFAYLGAFAPKPATFDEAAMQAVWETADPRPVVRTLVDRGLLEPVGQSRFWMHALLVDHARSFLTD